MIHTLTMNPAVDMTIRSGGLRPGEVNRTRDSVYDYNGKGVNVARVLRHLGEETAALGFFGGFSGRFIVDSLRDEGIPVYPIPVEDTTRVNIFLNDGSQEYKLVGEGARGPSRRPGPAAGPAGGTAGTAIPHHQRQPSPGHRGGLL